MPRNSSSTESATPQRVSPGTTKHPPRWVLASASPRRASLLQEAGQFFEIHPGAVREERSPGEAPAAFVRRLAREKADSLAPAQKGRWILGADTVVILGTEVLGKPANPQEAKAMLRKLSGRTHEVWTAVALRDPDGRFREVLERTEVVFRRLSEREVDQYVATGEPLDKAGAYGIQGGAGRFVTELRGSFTNVVGLPMERVRACLREAGLWVEHECGRRE